MATPPPTPPSPPQGDGTPDGGNPAHTSPPEVAPKPGRQSARARGGAGKPASSRTPRGKKADKAAKAPAAPKKPVAPRPAPRRAAARPRPRPAGPSIAAAPATQPADKPDATARKRGGWWKALAGGLGALAAGAALFSLRGSSRRRKPRAHQADGTDSSKSFAAGIADEGTIPE